MPDAATKTGRRASTNAAPASSGRLPEASSWKRPMWATAPRGLPVPVWLPEPHSSPQNTRHMACTLTREPVRRATTLRRPASARVTTTTADRALLSQPISSTAVTPDAGRAWDHQPFPYSGFPTSSALSSVICTPSRSSADWPRVNSPTGNSKYDSLQMKATKRFSHGLQAGGSFTWAQGFTRRHRQDFFNPASSNGNSLSRSRRRP